MAKMMFDAYQNKGDDPKVQLREVIMKSHEDMTKELLNEVIPSSLNSDEEEEKIGKKSVVILIIHYSDM